MLRIRRNDIVYVITGKDKSKTGKVLQANIDKGRVLVEGINRVKKHMRRTNQDQKGGVIEVEAPIHISNLQIYCKKCAKPARVGILSGKDGGRSRICKRCKEEI